MNNIHKHKSFDQSVVTTELAKSKNKPLTAAKVISLSILGLSSFAFAETINNNKITTYGYDAIALTGGTAIGAYTEASENGTSIGNKTITGKASVAVGAESYALGGGVNEFTFKELKKFGYESPVVNDSNYNNAKSNLNSSIDYYNYYVNRYINDLYDSNSQTDLDMKWSFLFENHTYKAKASDDIKRYVDDYKTYKNYDEILSDAVNLQNEMKASIKQSFDNYANNENISNYNNDAFENIKTNLNDKKNELLQSFKNKYIISTEEKMNALGDEKFQTLMTKIIKWQNTYPAWGGGVQQPDFTEEEMKILNDNFDLVQQYYEYKDTIEAANLFLNGGGYNGVTTYSGLLGNFTLLLNKLNAIDSEVNNYAKAVNNFNEEQNNYDSAVAIRNKKEAERIAKFNEILKSLNTEAAEALLDKGYTTLAQVLEALEGRAIAIGNQAYVSGDEAVGVGYGNTVLGSHSNVVGTHNNVTKANNNVMGNNNAVTVSEGNVIMGNNITFANGVTTGNNIALGTDTVISAPALAFSIEIQGVTHNFAGTNPTSVLSIASEGNERQIQNVAAGRVTSNSTDAINGSQLYAVVEALNSIQNINLDDKVVSDKLINGGVGTTITKNDQNESVINVVGITTVTDDGKSLTRSDLTKSVSIKGDSGNIHTSTTTNGEVQVNLADDIKINSITMGDVSISTEGINAGNKKVTNVALAEISPTSTDAVNGSQLYTTNQQVNRNTQNIVNLGEQVNHLDAKVNKVNKEARAGIAGTVATASLPQVYMAGKSMVSAATGHYKNENAVAVGYSRSSDNGRLILKLNSSANTRGDFTVGTGVGYQW